MNIGHMLLATLPATALVGQAPQFGLGVQLWSSPYAYAVYDVAADDVDGDGDVDLFTAAINQVVWHRNDGASWAHGVVVGNATACECCELADLDGDGDPDLLIGDRFGLYWFENLGNGFGPQISIETSPGVSTFWQDVRAADLDGDGDLDVLSASFSDDRIAWHENLGQGQFGSQQLISDIGNRGRRVFAVDVDGDADLDVVCYWSQGGMLALCVNLGSGSFSAPVLLGTSGTPAPPADLDGDGDPDLITRGVWRENLGQGFFGPAQPIGGTDLYFAADLDADGDQDVLGRSAIPDGLAVYENSGASVFVESFLPDPPGTFAFYCATAADLNGDGSLDAIGGGESGLFWFPQTTTVVSQATVYGVACGAGPLTMTPTSTAIIGSNMTAQVTNTPTILCVVALGWSDAVMAGVGALPLDLGSAGMPGCFLNQSSEVFGLGTSSAGLPQAMNWSLAVPTAPTALGLHVYSQAVSYAPGANARGVILSNGVDWRIGNQ